LLAFTFSVVIIIDIVYLFKAQIQKVSIFNSDQSNFVKFCDEYNLEILLLALLILSGLSIYQIMRR